MIERMILKGMFEKYPNLRLCLSHGGGLLAFNIWRLDHSYDLRPDLKKIIPDKPSGLLEKTLLRFHRSLPFGITILDPGRRRRPGSRRNDYPMAMGDFEPVRKVNSARTSPMKNGASPGRQRRPSLESLTQKHKRADRCDKPGDLGAGNANVGLYLTRRGDMKALRFPSW